MDSNVTLFHPAGARCVLALPDDAAGAFNAVNAYMKAGFLATPPDNAGTDTKQIGFAAHCKKGDKECLYFYEVFSLFPSSCMTIWIDGDDDPKIAQFERASGIRLASMPVVSEAPKRGSATFERETVKVNFTVTFDFEPPSAKYKTGRNLLKSYVGFANPAPQPEQQQQPATSGNGHSEPQQKSLPATHEKAFPNQPAAVKWALSWQARGVSSADIFNALRVDKLGDYEGTIEQATTAVEQLLANAAVKFEDI